MSTPEPTTARSLLERWLDASHPVFGITRDRRQLRFDTQQYLAAAPASAACNNRDEYGECLGHSDPSSAIGVLTHPSAAPATHAPLDE